MARYVYPVDPACPEVRRFMDGLMNDPMTWATGAPIDDTVAGFEKKHRRSCERCREFGAANVAID